MTGDDFRTIGSSLASAFRLSTRPLAVYGTEVLPAGIPPMAGINRCFAVSMYRMAAGREIPAIYIGAGATEGCCPGGLFHTGYIPVPDDIKYFVSTGKKDVRGGAAEFLKASPNLVEHCSMAAGPIHPPGKYLVVQACEALPDPMPDVLSLCIFGNGEQIRNMAALIHFDRDDPFSPVIVPWGSSCSTFITFPAGLAENTPRNTAFMGPQDPTQNHSMPPEMMALGIPADMAARMVKNLDASFITRRPQVAFPNHERLLNR
ncbi:DUF169 domain-containing protein [Methanoregula sp.]|uniref:DUF169 domain-containing protein n=1 Tax=Methanoregula sp. TaxID=2052170 RepID=UPI0025DB0E4C|nr:DUF169 domain-containing protein [Methanoregula sp.]